MIVEASLLTSCSRTKNVMTCVTAARPSCLNFRAEFSSARSSGAGCSWLKTTFVSACAGLLGSGGGSLVPQWGHLGQGRQMPWWDEREGREILAEERERFGALIGFKSRGVVLGLEGAVEAGPKSGASERKLR